MTTDLSKAILKNSPFFVKLFIERGADPNISRHDVSSTIKSNNNCLEMSVSTTQQQDDGEVNIPPLFIAIFNANSIACVIPSQDHYHSSSQVTDAIEITEVILNPLRKGTDSNALLDGICDIGTITVRDCRATNQLSFVLDTPCTPFDFIEQFIQCGCKELTRLIVEVNQSMLHVLNDFKNHNKNKNINKRPDFHSPTVAVHEPTFELWKGVLDDDEFTDMTFVCPDGQVKAHKCVLAAIPFFKTAFSGSWREVETGEWKTEKPVVIIKTLLRFIYTGLVQTEDLTEEQLPELFSTAAEYQMAALKKVFVKKQIASGLSLSNLSSMLELASLHNEPDLKNACFDYMKRNAATVMAYPGINQFAVDHPVIWQEYRMSCGGYRYEYEDDDDDDDEDGGGGRIFVAAAPFGFDDEEDDSDY